MSSGGPKRLVINSDRFLTDICPAVLQGLASQPGEANALEGDPELLSAIIRGNHRIIFNDPIYDEYENRSNTYPTIAWLSVIQELQRQGLIVKPRLSPLIRNIEGIPQRHNTFPLVAIRASADYLITEHQPWHDRADTIAEHGPQVITPGGFVRQYGA